MRIRSFHIDGFGIHRDFRLDELSPGLSVFYGPNEAGKSTLLAFLRGVLFGYPDGRSSEPKYVPVGGGAHGGRVTLSGPDGDVVVERFAGRGGKLQVTLEDGRPGDAVDLAERLGHADARLFRSVFAFGLAELAELGSLGDAGIQDQLFSAGVAGAGRSARQALRDLHEESRERFAGQRTRKQDRVKEIVREIVDVRAELFLRQEAAERYPDLRDVEQALAAKLDALGADASGEREEELRARKLVELWNEVWSPLAAAREQAAKLAPSVPESLPIDATACLESSLTRIQADQDRLESLRAERAAVAAELEELPLDEAARAVAVRVAALHERLALHRAQCERQGELQELRDECEARVTSVLNQLGEGFGESQLRALRPNAARRDELREHKERIDAARAAVQEGESAERVRVGQLDATRGHVHELAERARDGFRSNEGEVRDRAESLRVMRPLLLRLGDLEAQLARRTASLAHKEASRSLLSRGFSGGFLIVAVLIAAGVGIVEVGRPELLPPLVTLVFLGLGGSLIRRNQRRRRTVESRHREQDGLVETSRKIEELHAQASPHLALLEIEAAALSDAARTEEVLTAREAELEQERLHALETVRLAEDAREVRARLQVLEAQHEGEAECRRQARERLAALERDFHAWKREAEIPATLGAEAAREFLEDVRSGRDALEERDRLAAELRRVETDVLSFRADVDAVLAGAGLSGTTEVPSDDAQRIEALLRLRQQCESDRAAREGREPLERCAADLRQRFVERQRALELLREELRGLLDEAGAKDVEQLQRQIAASREAQQQQGRIEAMEAELARRLAAVGSPEAAILRVELPGGRVAEWEERATRAAERVDELGRSRDAILREHQDRARDRQRLEGSTVVMDLELRKASLEQELREVVDEWRQLRLAGRLIEAALERFERQHQPGVLREASQLFAQVTGGRYARIVQSDGRAGFSVVSEEGTHRGLGELSRGTTEQLYLCIRLGLVAELARAGRSLPVVTDDVLVNFDDARAAAMAKVLGTFADEHQLLFFTCSSRTRDLIASSGSNVDCRVL